MCFARVFCSIAPRERQGAKIRRSRSAVLFVLIPKLRKERSSGALNFPVKENKKGQPGRRSSMTESVKFV